MVNLHALQMTSSDNVTENLSCVEGLLAKLFTSSFANTGAHDENIVVLPECFSMFGCGGRAMLARAEALGDGEVQLALSSLAKQYQLYLVGGSMPITSNEPRKYFACSIIYGPNGELVSRYNKMHLFDVNVDDNTQNYNESAYTTAGHCCSVASLPFARVGQSICYDLRFPELYRKMNFPDIVVVPSAFTQVTGEAHWHALLKARAIENQCYVVAANQSGKHQDGRETFGHSCIYSPWGELLSIIKSGQGMASSVFNKDALTKIRKAMPVRSHIRGNYE